MPQTDPFRPSPLRRASSRTRTAKVPTPLQALYLYPTSGPASFSELYAGPVDSQRFPAVHPRFSPATVNYKFSPQALQIYAFYPSEGRPETAARQTNPGVALIADLGKSMEIARIELYGNLLLPPLDAASGPLFNFGLPRRVGVAVAEAPSFRQDLHGVPNFEAWLSSGLNPFHSRYEAQDLRALWGWTTLSLPPTFGRYLYFHFADLPLIYSHVKGAPEGRGIDIQRLLVYPYLEDSDHHPVVEGSLLSIRQNRYPQPGASSYWIATGDQPPQPDTHQSVSVFPSRLPLPTVFDWLPVEDSQSEWTYQSDLIELNSDNRIVLTIAATSDEIPVLDAIRLYRLTSSSSKDDPQVARDQDLLYTIDVLTTNDEEAAWSADLAHPSWRLVRSHYRAAASSPIIPIDFCEPVRARYVRAVVALSRTPQADPSLLYGRLRLSGCALGRCRHFVLAPEPQEDLKVDSVLLRFRGKSLTQDYAFLNGESGISLALEQRTAGGPFEEIRNFRNLLDLVENANARVVSNPRFGDKPVQDYKEHVVSTQSGNSRTETPDSQTTTSSSLPAGARNVTVSRTGSTTAHVENAAQALAARGTVVQPPFPSHNTAGVSTKRIYDYLPNSLPDPSLINDPASFAQFLSEIASDASNTAIPINLGLGLSGGAGAQAVIGGNVGLSFSIGMSIGGGNTRSVVRGDQASVADSQTTTLFSESHQFSTSTGYSVQSRTADSVEDRTVHRQDLSQEVRKSGLAVRYGGLYQDIILITIPVRALLSGRSYRQSAADTPATTGDLLRLRVDHLPQDVVLDVEFRGTILPRRED